MANPDALVSLLRPERARGVTRRATWFTLLGLVLVPLTVGGLLTWALWQPTQHLDRVTAAVVNLDEPVTLDGQTVPLGRQLTAGLVTSSGTSSSASPSPSASVTNVAGHGSSTNLTWVITNVDDAAAGLQDGTYATVVTIPANFSAAATSTGSDPTNPQRATIDIAVSERSRMVDSAVTQAVTSTATRVLGQQLTSTYLQNVLVAFSTLHSSLGEASDGASSLATGATGVSDGASALASGAGQLAAGTSALTSGADQLAGGATKLGSGASSLASGAASLSSGVGQVASGATSLSSGAASLSTGVGQLATGLAALDVGVNTGTATTPSLADGVASASAGADQLDTGLDAFLDGISRLAAGCAAQVTGTCAQLSSVIAGQQDATSPTSLASGAGALAAGLQSLDTAINTDTSTQPGLATAVSQLAAGAQQAASGAASLATGASQLATGATQASSGASSLASGASQLATGANQLAPGASQLANGASQLGDGVTSLADGATQLADGAGQLSGGASSLSEGLGTAVEQLPNLTTEQATSLADVVADPVTSTGDTELFGSRSVPPLLVVALWLGALATFLLITAIPARALGSTRSSVSLTLLTFLPGAVVGGLQGLALTAIMAGALDLSPARWVALAVVSAAEGVAFAAVNLGLVALLRGVGRFAAVVVAVIGLGCMVISTTPPLLDQVFGLTPIAPALSLVQGVVTGHGGLLGPMLQLLAWTVAGLGATAAAIARHRVVPAGQLARWARAA